MRAFPKHESKFIRRFEWFHEILWRISLFSRKKSIIICRVLRIWTTQLKLRLPGHNLLREEFRLKTRTIEDWCNKKRNQPLSETPSICFWQARSLSVQLWRRASLSPFCTLLPSLQPSFLPEFSRLVGSKKQRKSYFIDLLITEKWVLSWVAPSSKPLVKLRLQS